MDTHKARKLLEQEASMFEIYEVTRFVGYREGESGVPEEVTIEILDLGPDVSERYTCHASTEDGKEAGGNPAATLEEALGIVH